MTSVWCHFLLKTSEKLHTELSYIGLSLCKIWLCLIEEKRSYEGGLSEFLKSRYRLVYMFLVMWRIVIIRNTDICQTNHVAGQTSFIFSTTSCIVAGGITVSWKSMSSDEYLKNKMKKVICQASQSSHHKNWNPAITKGRTIIFLPGRGFPFW